MADKGLVSKSTLQGFADEVRRLAESEQTGTPAEMLALLQAVEAGADIEIKTGTFTSTGNASVTLGTTFSGEDYYFLMGARGYNDSTVTISSRALMVAEIKCISGTITGVVYNYDGVYKSPTVSTLNQSNGKFTTPNTSELQFTGSMRYHWLYVGGKFS